MSEQIAGRARSWDKLDVIEKHIHGSAMVYPQLAAPITLTKAAGAWAAYPTPTEIIPANTIISDFDIHWISIANISATGNYMLRLYTGAAGSEVFLCELDFYRTAVNAVIGSQPGLSPIIKKNTRISAAISSGNAAADTADIKLRYHTY